MTIERKSKRSRRVALTSLTAVGAAAALGGCSGWGDEPETDGRVYASVAECVADGRAQDECQNAWTQAQSDDANDAPRFESRDLCEGDFGSGACQQRADSTGSFWVPLLAGFVIAEVVDEIGDSRRRRRYAPLYRNRSSGTWYTGGYNYSPLRSNGGSRYGMRQSAFAPVSAPRIASRSDVASRSGFGGRSGSRSSGSWGG